MTTVNLSDEEVAELRAATKQSDVDEALRTARRIRSLHSAAGVDDPIGTSRDAGKLARTRGNRVEGGQ